MNKFFIKIFIFTRLIFLFLIIYSNLISDSYDLSNKLISDKTENQGYIETFLNKFMSYFYSYDSVHFVHIAKKWYTNDKNFAFFPLFPIIINYTSFVVNYLFGIFNIQFADTNIILIFTGFLVSNAFCFINLLLLEK
jgi:hypothetical protein